MTGDWLEGAAIAPRVNATEKKQLLASLAEVAARAFAFKASDVLAALTEREAQGSTGVGHGVAIPHGPLAGLTRIHGVFARLETPVDFAAVDEEPVDLVLALLVPPGRGADHLRALARASRLLRQRRLCEQLRAARTADALRALLVQEARPTAA